MTLRYGFDLSVYFVADPSVCAGRDVVEVTAAAVKGGVTMVQYRDKIDPSPEVAKQLLEISHSYGAAFLIDDEVELAKEIEADGVHLGQDDMEPVQAREFLGEEAIIGVTSFTEEQITAINPAVVDYIGTGPVYETKTDKGKPVLGVERFEELVNCSSVPIVGIGGIRPDNAGPVIESGADGVAMMRAISETDDPCIAADGFINAVAAARLGNAL